MSEVESKAKEIIKMEKIKLPNASVLTSPNPVSLVCTQKPDGSTNLATVSWWTYLSFNPSTIGYAMGKKSYSGEMVRSSKKVVLTIPGKALKDAVMGCGSSSGRDTDKIAKFGISMQNLPDCDIQIPEHTCVAIQCTLKEYHEVGDHYLYICSVDQVFGNEKEEPLFAWDGYAKIATAIQGE